MTGRIENLFKPRTEGCIITDLNSFNHGTTSISYENIIGEPLSTLKRLLQKGWGIIPKKISQVVEKIFYSNNFKVETDEGTFLLKKSKNSPQTQPLVDAATRFCENQGIPVTHIQNASDSNTFIVYDNQVYRLDKFIEGEHFDGSRRELIEVASQLPRFFHILSKLPIQLQENMKEDNRTLIHHDWDQLEALLTDQEALKSNYSVHDEEIKLIRHFSQLISSMSERLKSLPIDIIHRDLHPHNLLFNKKNHILLAFLDLDALLISQRIRGIAFAMHRLARTFGQNTEKKQDLGSDLRERMELFLNTYLDSGGELTDEEINLIPYVLLDHTLYAIAQILLHTSEGSKEWPKDLGKQIEMLREIESVFRL